MIIKTDDFKKYCNTISQAVDSAVISTLTETLELVAENGVLNLNVTNKEYFVNVKMSVPENIVFHATVNANLFLRLISQTTTEDVELTIVDNALVVEGNGTYKFPIIYEDDSILTLPTITIGNVTETFDVSNDILMSILNNNSKQISECGVQNALVQRMYYLDSQGCITFATTGCVNSESINMTSKILLTDKVVKLFKLFKEDTISCTLGFDYFTNNIIQTKVCFTDGIVTVTSIIPSNEKLLSQVPVSNIRAMSTCDYSYNLIINRKSLVDSLNRILIFVTKSDIKTYGTLVFNSDKVDIYFGAGESKSSNVESVVYTNECPSLVDKTLVLDLTLLKSVIDSSPDEYITISFSDDSRCVVTRKKSITNIIPLCR